MPTATTAIALQQHAYSHYCCRATAVMQRELLSLLLLLLTVLPLVLPDSVALLLQLAVPLIVQ
jgi:hypothetical protein